MNKPALIQRLLIPVLAALTCAWAAGAAAVPSPGNFLSEAVRDSRAEIQACNLALEKAQNPEVKQFAQRMIKDHSELSTKIEAVAKKKGVSLPPGISMTQKGRYELLDQTPQSHFDKAFMDHNVSDHKSDVKTFSEEAQEATDRDVKALASEALPQLQTHLRLAEDLDAKIQ